MTARYFLFLAGSLALSAGLAWATLQSARLLRTWTPPFNPLLQREDLILRLILCGVCVGLGLLSGAPPEVLGWRPVTPGRDLAIGGAVGLGLAALFYFSTRWLTARSGGRFYSTVVVDLIAPHSRRELALVALALIPSVLLEELLFRSLWIGGMGMALSVLWLALASSALFGLMHSPQGVWGVTGAALASLLFAGLFLWAGSLLLPLAAHYVANVVQLAVAGGAAATAGRNARPFSPPPHNSQS